MGNLTTNFFRSLQFIILLFLVSNAGAADIANISGGNGAMYWDIDSSIKYSSADLRVSSPGGNVSAQLFEPSVTPFYPSEDAVLVDGHYNYELTLNPEPGAQALVQSGGFSIENGALVNPAEAE